MTSKDWHCDPACAAHPDDPLISFSLPLVGRRLLNKPHVRVDYLVEGRIKPRSFQLAAHIGLVRNIGRGEGHRYMSAGSEPNQSRRFEHADSSRPHREVAIFRMKLNSCAEPNIRHLEPDVELAMPAPGAPTSRIVKRAGVSE